jgi:probable rRNA maturation factor
MPPDGQRRQRLRVLITDERGRTIRRAALASWLARIAPPAARGIVSIAVVSDQRIKALNRQYRWKDCVTDVLSFPSHQSPAPSHRSSSHRSFSGHSPAASHRLLGDVVIARGLARRQARAARHSELTELKILALHGLLHLLGYDHETDAGRMRRVEQRLRRKGGLRAGLIERAHGPRPARR